MQVLTIPQSMLQLRLQHIKIFSASFDAANSRTFLVGQPKAKTGHLSCSFTYSECGRDQAGENDKGFHFFLRLISKTGMILDCRTLERIYTLRVAAFTKQMMI